MELYVEFKCGIVMNLAYVVEILLIMVEWGESVEEPKMSYTRKIY